jgi:hypothetical protein
MHRFGLGLLLATSLLGSGCMTTRVVTIQDDCSTFARNSRSQKVVTAYFWGLVQPKDVNPGCETRGNSNHLNAVQVETNLGYYLLSGITLGIVQKQRLSWCCMPFDPAPTPAGKE